MKSEAWCLVGITLMVALPGCRATTGVKEVPRVDLQLDGANNRGYLTGVAPAAAQQRTTRQLLNLSIEVPWVSDTAVDDPTSLEGLAPPEIEMEATGRPESWTSPAEFDSYTVMKGDSLWSIAAQPGIYGRATRWRSIFDANRDLLNSPSDLRANMELRIPRGAVAAESKSTFTK